MKIIPAFGAVLVAALLVGCKLRVPPFDSASVEIRQTGGVVVTGALYNAQVEHLKEWLTSRRTGWEHRAESASVMPAFLVKLAHQGKVVGHITITEHEVRIGHLVRQITAEERRMVHLLFATFLSKK